MNLRIHEFATTHQGQEIFTVMSQETSEPISDYIKPIIRDLERPAETYLKPVARLRPGAVYGLALNHTKPMVEWLKEYYHRARLHDWSEDYYYPTNQLVDFRDWVVGKIFY